MPIVTANGIELYYTDTGAGEPLVLVMGFGGDHLSWGFQLSALSAQYRVVTFDNRGSGQSSAPDVPYSTRMMADDTVAALRQLGIVESDVFGYSMGSGVALEIAIRYPDLVRKLVLASLTYTRDGFHPGLLEGIEGLQPEHLAGTPWQEEYARIAPRPGDWPALIAKTKEMDRELQGWPADALRSLKAPTLLIIGDSDIVRPEHVVEMFRLLGGGVVGDLVGLPRSQLAVLPGTMHVTLVDRAQWLASMITEFLDAPN